MSAYSIVYLAEKHSIAEALADVLPGRSVKRNGYIECGSAAVTWLSGHLLEQAPPEAYDPAYKRWSRETLPIVPEVFKYTVRRDRNIPKQLAVIKICSAKAPRPSTRPTLTAKGSSSWTRYSSSSAIKGRS